MKKKKKSNPFNIIPLSHEAHYVVECQTTGDCFQNFFATAEDAIAWAEYEWEIQGFEHNKGITHYFVARCEYNGDEDDPDYSVLEDVKVWR